MLAVLSGKGEQEEFWGSSFFETPWLSGLMQGLGMYKGKQKARKAVRYKVNEVYSMLPQLVCLFSILVYLKGVYSTAD